MQGEIGYIYTVKYYLALKKDEMLVWHCTSTIRIMTACSTVVIFRKLTQECLIRAVQIPQAPSGLSRSQLQAHSVLWRRWVCLHCCKMLGCLFVCLFCFLITTWDIDGELSLHIKISGLRFLLSLLHSLRIGKCSSCCINGFGVNLFRNNLWRFELLLSLIKFQILR